MKFLTAENKISLPDLPANGALMTFRIKKLAGLFAGDKAFANAIKPLLDEHQAIWITNQISHIAEENKHQLLWVDDLDWLKYPQWQTKSREAIGKNEWQKKAQRITNFASFSNYYTDILTKEMGVPENQVNVISPFYQNEMQPAAWSEKESTKTQYTGGDDFFVFSGDIHNRHHIISILKAYSIFKKWQKSSMKLVITGYTTEHTANILQSIETYKHREDVIIITDPDEKEKQQILSAAYACIYTAESISLPLTMPDAMKSGVPLIVSDIPNMKEWGLDHALYANASDETQIAEKMILLYKDEALRSRLVENALQFSATSDKNSTSLLSMLHSLFPANFAATIK